MSTSAILAAKKRAENSLRHFQLPTTSQPQPQDSDGNKNGVLLLSLLQSRLNWASSVFVRYRPDSTRQPKRTNNTRRKWPNMRYLGTCTLELGPHLFPDTIFYEAIRGQSWSDIAKEAGYITETSRESEDPSESNDPENMGHLEEPISGEAMDVDKDESEQPVTDSTKDVSTTEQKVDHTQDTAAHSTNPIDPPVPPPELVFSDVVFEFKDAPNERFIFPKDVILELMSMQAPFELVASFLLPLDQTVADEYFIDPKLKIARWGEHSRLANGIIEKAKEEAVDPSVKPHIDFYTPANIRMLQVDGDILKALVSYITKPELVRHRMMEKMQTLPVQSYLRYTSSGDPIDRSEMVHRSYTVPEIITGPVLAEKKRNEQLNAVKIGKRPRTENTEGSLPKTKNVNQKDDGIRKCHYCSTKHTAMWRPGPTGSGTLCNGCGILWKQGKILKGAPVITKEEEKALEREAREKERLLQEQRERERLEQESILLAKKAELARHRLSSDGSMVPTDQQIQTQTCIKQEVQQNRPIQSQTYIKQEVQQKQQSITHSKKPIDTRPQPPPPATDAPNRPATAIAPQQTPLSLYSNAGIPLPTLSIDFGQMFFAHPNCGVTLVDGHFSIRLCKEGFPPTTLDIDKRDLQQASFDVITEGQLGREVLIMTCSPGGDVIERFNMLLIKPRESSMRIQFLEKLDPTGGAVVKRILERWLSTLSTI
ncbi:hypothetical protein CLU79DRAFT_710538 [Phycomyces nitens]|nr:hypothetical protein CLU79DRAFT_710538 [Phycomyces nitens]